MFDVLDELEDALAKVLASESRGDVERVSRLADHSCARQYAYEGLNGFRITQTDSAVRRGPGMGHRRYRPVAPDASELRVARAVAWVVAAMASEQTDFASRPDDIARTVFGQIGEMLFATWGGT